MEKTCQTCDRDGKDKACKSCLYMPFVEAYPLSMRKKFKDSWKHGTDWDKLMEEKQITFDEMRGV